MRQLARQRLVWLGDPASRQRWLGDAGTSTTQCAIDLYDNASQAQTIQACTTAAIQVSAQYSSAGAAIWQGIADELKADLAASAAVSGALVATAGILSMVTGSQVTVAALLNGMFNIVAVLLGYIGVEVTAAQIAAAFGPYAVIAEVVVVVVSAIVDLTVYLEQYDAHLQITNGTTFAVRDYGGVVKTAATWLQNAKPSDIVGLTALGFANQASIFLANPTWLYVNQGITGLAQPPPPDQGKGDGIDTCYSQMPGAQEMLNVVQYALACQFVSSSPGMLPLFQCIPEPTGAPVTIAGIPVDPAMLTVGNPNNYGPLWAQGGLSWVPPGLVSVPGGGNPATNSPTVQAAGSYTVWPAGNNFGGGSGPIATAPALDSGNPEPNIGYQSFVYAGCPNLATNDNTRDSSGRITGQTNIAKGIFWLQGMFPTLTTSQCLMIFTANGPAYNKTILNVLEWANTQCSVTAYDLTQQFAITPADATAIVSRYTSTEPGCIDKQSAIILAQTWANEMCPAPTAARILYLTGGAYPAGPLTQADADKIVASWANPKCSATPAPTPASLLSAPVVTSKVVRAASLVAGAGTIALVWFAARNGLTLTRATTLVYGRAKTVATQTAKRLKPRLRARGRR